METRSRRPTWRTQRCLFYKVAPDPRRFGLLALDRSSSGHLIKAPKPWPGNRQNTGAGRSLVDGCGLSHIIGGSLLLRLNGGTQRCIPLTSTAFLPSTHLCGVDPRLLISLLRKQNRNMQDSGVYRARPGQRKKNSGAQTPRSVQRAAHLSIQFVTFHKYSVPEESWRMLPQIYVLPLSGSVRTHINQKYITFPSACFVKRLSTSDTNNKCGRAQAMQN